MTAVTRPARHKKPFPWKEALRILVLTLISLLMIFPIFWMVSGSLKAPHEVMNKDVFWPAKPYLENYAIAWKSAPFGQYFKKQHPHGHHRGHLPGAYRLAGGLRLRQAAL